MNPDSSSGNTAGGRNRILFDKPGSNTPLGSPGTTGIHRLRRSWGVRLFGVFVLSCLCELFDLPVCSDVSWRRDHFSRYSIPETQRTAPEGPTRGLAGSIDSEITTRKSPTKYGVPVVLRGLSSSGSLFSLLFQSIAESHSRDEHSWMGVVWV